MSLIISLAFMFKDVGSIIPKSVGRAGIGSGLEKSDIMKYFMVLMQEYIKPEQLNKIKPVFKKENTLIIAVLSDELVSIIRNNEAQIIRKIAEKFGQDKVKSLKFLT